MELHPTPLAGWAPSATVAVGNAGEVKAARGDGHSLTAKDAANSSGGGGSNSSFLREEAEDGSMQRHHHGRGLDDDGGVLALPDTGLIAAAGQRGRATGRAWLALITAGHVLGLEVHLGERAGKKQNMGMHEEQPVITMRESMHMHLKMKVREKDERARSWAGFYNGPKLPHFHRHPLQQ